MIHTAHTAARWFARAERPANHVPLALTIAWGSDFLNASTFVPLFYGPSITETNNNELSLAGATPEELRAWKYGVTDVPSVDGNVERCLGLIGGAQVRCWASLDQFLMQQVVPAVPLVFESHVEIVSDRVVHYSFDQSTALPALDQIALSPD